MLKQITIEISNANTLGFLLVVCFHCQLLAQNFNWLQKLREVPTQRL
jgi:hypothetical protein